MQMPYTRRIRSTSPPASTSPVRSRRSRSRSLSREPRAKRSRSRSQDPDEAGNPGNNLYVTGLSTRTTRSDLEKYFNAEGKVVECQLVKDPRTRESRGFGFVTMETNEDADRCIKHLNRSVLEGRLITVEKAKRKCGRTPTPGKYLGGSRDRRGPGGRRSRSYSPSRRRDRDHYSRDQRRRSRSPYNSKKDDDHPDSHGRRRDLSPPRSGGYSR